jgi:hypothetical protein
LHTRRCPCFSQLGFAECCGGSFEICDSIRFVCGKLVNVHFVGLLRTRTYHRHFKRKPLDRVEPRRNRFGIELLELLADVRQSVLMAVLSVLTAVVIEVTEADRARRPRLLQGGQCFLDSGKPSPELCLLGTEGFELL